MSCRRPHGQIPNPARGRAGSAAGQAGRRKCLHPGSQRCRFIGLRRIPGPAHDLAGVPALLVGLRFGALVRDRAFDADWLMEDLKLRGAAAVPSRRHRQEPRDHDREMYGWRHRIENLFARIKELQAITTRYDKTDESFAAAIHLVAGMAAAA